LNDTFVVVLAISKSLAALALLRAFEQGAGVLEDLFAMKGTCTGATPGIWKHTCSLIAKHIWLEQ